MICYFHDENREEDSMNDYYGEIQIYDINSDKMRYSYECEKNLSDAFDYDDKKNLILIDGIVIDIRSNKVILDAYQLEDKCNSNSNLIHPYKDEVIISDYVWDLRKNCPYKEIASFYDLSMYELNESGNMLLCYSCLDTRNVEKELNNKKNSYFSIIDSDNYSIYIYIYFYIDVVKQKGPVKNNVINCHFHPEDLLICCISGNINSNKNNLEYFNVGESYYDDNNGYNDSESDIDDDNSSEISDDLSELESLM